MISQEMFKLMQQRLFASGPQPKTAKQQQRMTPAQVQRIHQLIEQGWNNMDISGVMGVSRHHVAHQRYKVRQIKALGK